MESSIMFVVKRQVNEAVQTPYEIECPKSPEKMRTAKNIKQREVKIHYIRRYNEILQKNEENPAIFSHETLVGTAIGYREDLLVSFGLSVLAVSSVLANLDMEMDPTTGEYKALIELLPARLFRYFLITCILHHVCAPLYKVVLADFFLADQFTSQVQAFRSFEFYICYYTSGKYKVRENTCRSNDVYNTFNIIVAGTPYFWRLLQCLRRLFEEKDTS
ncbi:hypothetical protein AgCh_028742 [Apium graveolens]